MAEAEQAPTVLTLDGALLRCSDFAGYGTLAELASCSVHGGAGLPRFDADQPHYPATLHLLALHAARAEAPPCAPLAR